MSEILFCQSCSMPLEKEVDFATNADGSCNKEYCIFCYKKGEFTEPDLTLEEVLDNVEKIMKEMSMTEDVIEETKLMIPNLKRWKK